MFPPPAATPARYAAAVQAVALPVLRSAPTVRPARSRGPAPSQSRTVVRPRPDHVRAEPRRPDPPGTLRARAAVGSTYPAAAAQPPASERVWRLVWSLGAPPPPRAGGDRRASVPGWRPLLPPGAIALVPPHRSDWIEAAAASTALGEAAFCWPGNPPEQAQPWVRTPRSPDPSPVLLEYLLWLGTARPQRWRELAAQSLWMVLSVLLEGCPPTGLSAGRGDGRSGTPAPPTADPLPTGTDGRGLEERVEPGRPELAAALRYVRDAWREGPRPLTLVELADAAAVSRGHFARMFQAHFGVGAITALEQVRLAHAEQLLEAGELNVSQVARACGFADPLHFSRRFRATHGLAPQVFRRTPEAAVRRCDSAAVRTLVRLTGI
ncbi:helix-turn-helix protein [Kitasatospora sp. SolWspMP-SS2h]|uniref:helix-turn-helix domain-containing protein n=1 Tax=Kitasatospora sp. SolWspMP-SS2h TaxID=1305729 RepID=UPI000DB9F95D|nr:helix-turn-helix transcriptional regulator [Kitasatospora sp. SolWspMP-SS2h]RAJ36810.1 helix-turn-helix protein [Kitasatospora sp. SolWspMP-SS2h]